MYYQFYTIRVDLDMLDVDRDKIMVELADLGVSSRVYFPALHRKAVFAPFGPYEDSQFPNALTFEKTAFTLPNYTDFTPKEQSHVVASVLKVIQSHKI